MEKPANGPQNHQRVGAISNAHAGREFEAAARIYFEKVGIVLQKDFSIDVGYARKRPHKFDLGSSDPAILVECKSYTWTSGGKSPSAKIRGMNEAMLLFSVAPPEFRKILFVLKHLRKDVSLARHYLKTQGHLIGPGVELWELDFEAKDAERLL